MVPSGDMAASMARAMVRGLVPSSLATTTCRGVLMLRGVVT